MMSEETESLKAEVVGLRSALTTVTEALILFQEFIEVEIGEMSYFRDSGSYSKLVDIFNKLRTDTLRAVSPCVNAGATTGNQKISLETNNIHKRSRLNNMPMYDKLQVVEADDDEQIEVHYDEESTDEISTDEITISKVYSVSPLPATVVTPTTPDILESPTPLALVTTVFSSSSSPEEKDLHDVPQQYSSTDSDNGNDHYFQETPLNLSVTASSSSGTRNSGNATSGSDVSAAPRPGRPRGRGRPKRSDKQNKLTEKLASETSAAVATPKKSRKRSRSDFPVMCPECFKGYSSKGVLSRHIKEAHQSEPQFPCFYCPQKFRNGPSRLEHMHKAHPNDFNSVICPYCNKKASTATGKRSHMTICAAKHKKPRDRSRRKKKSA